MGTVLIVNNAESSVKKFAQDIADIVNTINYPFKIVQYKDLPGFEFDSISGVIMSGSPRGNDIVAHHLPYFQWLKTTNKPVLGVCAGHHITGSLYGSELLRGQEPEAGDFYVEVLIDGPLFQGMPKRFKVKQMHNDSITIPAGFELIATSATCTNQMMKHKDKPLYSCQFHPEYYNHKLILNFLGLI